MKELPVDNVVTDSAGLYTLWAQTGDVLIQVRAPQGSGFADFQIHLTHTSGDSLLNLKFPSSPVLSGVVKDHKGSPVAGISVAVVKD